MIVFSLPVLPRDSEYFSFLFNSKLYIDNIINNKVSLQYFV